MTNDLEATESNVIVPEDCITISTKESTIWTGFGFEIVEDAEDHRDRDPDP